MSDTRQCTKCGLAKPETDFWPAKKQKRSHCKLCMKAADAARKEANREKARAASRRSYYKHREARVQNAFEYNRVQGWANSLAARSRASAVRKGWAYELSPKFLRELWTQQDGRCAWLGIAMVPLNEKRNPLQPSVDRIDCEKGYTRDNVVLACQFANMGRSEMSADRFREFVADLASQLSNPGCGRQVISSV